MASSGLKTATDGQPRLLVSVQLGTSTTTAVYTTPANTSTKLMNGSVCNISGAAANVSVELVPAGGTAGTTHRVIHNYSLAAGDTLSLKDYLGDHVLGPGDFIVAFAGTATAVDLVISGVVFS